MFGLARNAYKYVQKKRHENSQMTIMLIGLDDAGKTTVLSDFKGDKNPFIAPTVGFSKPLKMKRGKYQVTVYDLGGGVRIRNLWSNYFADVHGAIFVVDAADEGRLKEAKEELVASIGHTLLAGKPILIVANKQDLKEALDVAEISERMGLEELTTCRHSIIKCVADPRKNGGIIDERIFEGLNWLLKAVGSDYAKLNGRVKVDQEEAKEARKKRFAAQRERVQAYKKEKAEGAAESKGGDGKKAAPAADPDVIMCSVCQTSQATGRSAASKWLPVCESCLGRLTAGEDVATLKRELAGGGASSAAGGTAAPAAAAEEVDDGVPKCSVCSTRAATKKSGKLGWQPVCDECDPDNKPGADDAGDGGGDAAVDTGSAEAAEATAGAGDAAGATPATSPESEDAREAGGSEAEDGDADEAVAAATRAAAQVPLKATPPADAPDDVPATPATPGTSAIVLEGDEAAAAPTGGADGAAVTLPGALASPAKKKSNKLVLAPLSGPPASTQA